MNLFVLLEDQYEQWNYDKWSKIWLSFKNMKTMFSFEKYGTFVHQIYVLC